MTYFFKIFFLVIFIFPQLIFAQKEATHWNFGPKLGLDFTNGSPSIIKNSALLSYRGCASISDKKTGELLFYSNGWHVWDRFNDLMPNSHQNIDTCINGLNQSVLILPIPGNNYEYYLFYITFYGNENNALYLCSALDPGDFTGNYYYQLSYSVIDLRLNNGRGDIRDDKKDILLQTHIDLKLTAVPKTDSTGYWLITHGIENSFFNYQINSSGIDKPNEQKIGSSHRIYFKDGTFVDKVSGELKASPNGKMLACTVADNKYPFDVFDFDALTGIISNHRNFGDIIDQYGTTFSPDNTKLYVTSSNRIDKTALGEVIRQYDLTLPTTEDIIKSAKSIIRFNPFTNISEKSYPVDIAINTLHLAPDGKIYIATSGLENSNLMYVISKPNAKGFDCDINYKYFDFNTSYFFKEYRSLPNFIQSYFNNLEPINETDCADALIIAPNPTNGIISIKAKEACGKYSFTIANMLGQIVKNESADLIGEKEVDIKSLASGIYLIIFNFSGKRLVKKVIKVD